MSSVVVSRTAMTKECDCYVIQNSEKATKRCHSFHPVYTGTQSSWTHDRYSRCFYNKYTPWKNSFISIRFHHRSIFTGGLCKCETSHSVCVVDFFHGHDIRSCPYV